MPGRGWASRHHATRQRIRKLSASWSPPSYHEYRISDEKEALTTIDDWRTDANTSGGTPKGAGANEEDVSMVVKKPDRSPSKCVVSEKKRRFSAALPNDEISRDFVAITGKKLLVKRTERSPSKCVALQNDEIARYFMVTATEEAQEEIEDRSGRDGSSFSVFGFGFHNGISFLFLLLLSMSVWMLRKLQRKSKVK